MAFPGTYNISYYKGDTLDFELYPKDANGDVFSLEDYSAKFTVSTQRGNSLTLIGNPTISIASPAVITLNAHGLENTERVIFTSTGSLPANIENGRQYFVKNATLNTFEISSTLGGVSINTTGNTQSGTHTVYKTEEIIGYTQISPDFTKITCAITPENGELFVAGTTYVYDVEISNLTAENYDKVYTILTGNITVTDQISGASVPVGGQSG